MTAIAAVLAITAVVLGYLVYLLNKRVALLAERLRWAIPYLKKAGLSFEELEEWWPPFEWVFVASGGDTEFGIVGGLGLCPCQKEYTVNTRRTVHQQRPNAAQTAACLANPPLLILRYGSVPTTAYR